MTTWNYTVEKDGVLITGTLDEADAILATEAAESKVPTGGSLVSVTVAPSAETPPPTMQSPNGKWWQMSVDNNGQAVWKPLTGNSSSSSKPANSPAATK